MQSGACDTVCATDKPTPDGSPVQLTVSGDYQETESRRESVVYATFVAFPLLRGIDGKEDPPSPI